ncbi:hypothetical protein AB6A40_008763 [Gnathostoma spinigerum]|uniref:6-phosphogluconolactonase n=1 Tax=Gnathostoma spinigerum TaxID=75299 RepID=A0ABD6EXR6_9BILA
MPEPEIHVYDSEDALREGLRKYLVDIIEETRKNGQVVTVGLSGGSMPSTVGPVLIDLKDTVDWTNVRLFVVDERMVEINDPDSNTGAYLKQLPDCIKKSFINYGPIDDIEVCAKNYEAKLKSSATTAEDSWPMFSVLFLGHGDDGHTCSLFPNHPLLKFDSSWVAAIEDSPKPPPRRITITLPVINHAQHVAFISKGQSKAKIIKAIIKDKNEALPAAQVRPTSNYVSWFLDKAAASDL